jgi:peroxiredoxin
MLFDHQNIVTPLYGDRFAGDCVVLAFCWSITDPVGVAVLRGLQAAIAGRNSDGIRIFAVCAGSPGDAAILHAALGLTFAVLADPALGAWRAFGASPDAPSPIIVIDPNRRIAACCRGSDATAALDVAARLLAKRQPATLGEHPPVLVLPRVLEPADCATLIEIWHRPVRRYHSDGFTSAAYRDETGEFKIRIDSYGRTDQFVLRDPIMVDRLDALLARRIMPQIEKAFRQRAEYREDYRIACYDAAESGALPAHRDDTLPQVRYRLFTASVHLNAGEYEGGYLRFPEYGAHRYDVDPGTAIVWSCSLQHEVTAVTRGRRFILGTHYFSDLAAMQATSRSSS